MSYYQKFLTTFAGKKSVLFLIAGFFTLTSMSPDRANFSGAWKLNESKSGLAGSFPLCIFGGGDRMRSKTMKIADQADFLLVESSSSFDGVLDTRQEKLTFDGKESEVVYVGSPRKKSTAKWSDDGRTMTVNSVKSLDATGEKPDFKVTEIWKLINGGKSISIQVKSSSTDGEHVMMLIYDKAS